MMVGTVSNRRVLLRVTFRLPNQPDLTIEFVIDTGFTDFLTLPAAAVAAMALPFLGRLPAVLADGTTVLLDTYQATILWNGAVQNVRVFATGTRPLIGTSLLDGHELLVQFTDGGLVTVDPLSGARSTSGW
jgi:clan AA aspartic protease